MNEALWCGSIVMGGFGCVGLWKLARCLFEHELRLELLEEIELVQVRERGERPPTLKIARPDDGPDLAA